MTSISNVIRQQVISEAGHRCEYCRTSSRLVGMPLVLDHIIPKSLGGNSDRENIAASCYRCNEFKGARTQGIDSKTGELIPFFNPRRQKWTEHFVWANGGTHIIGLTAIGRVTVIALRLNNEYIVEARRLWTARDWHPP
ncbi:HNH endonuclease signature motif containing protein [Tumidithrix elongata RA019]|uniref:HNH endonuclease signature motif containing protein n=1 Tax=Tumidithrix elongata BACA0141 TaxID=2716417 RepID=A0AAW9PT32_9CYAN|nr:HNH endonuclease signature motif containing protein [Tumidithrix elongata RA019]